MTNTRHWSGVLTLCSATTGGPGLGPALHRNTLRRFRARAHDARGESRPAQSRPRRRHPHRPRLTRRQRLGRARGTHRPLLWRAQSRRDAPPAAHRRHRDAAPHPAPVRRRRDPWVSHHLPRAARRSRELGSQRGRGVGAHHRHRSRQRWHSVDVRADGRHRARSALGAHRGRLRRRSVPRLRLRRGARAWVSGGDAARHRHRQALRRLRRGGRWARLQHRRRLGLHAARRVSAAVQGRHRCGGHVSDGRLRRPRRCADACESAAHQRLAARHLAFWWHRCLGLHRHHGAFAPWRRWHSG